MAAAFDALLNHLAADLGVARLDVNGVLAVALVGLVCGLVGALVTGNRMAFFSDAMAHCAFAGTALGVLSVLLTDPGVTSLDAAAAAGWRIPLVMVGFGAVVGVGIAFFRERSGLTTDSVIGVFFALAVGFGAMLLPELSKKVRFDAEAFLFGSPVFARPEDLLLLLALAVVTAGFVVARFNAIVFASFSPSLARSRRVDVRLNNYLFVLLLTLVVNLSIRAVGVLLINALLVVPAAAAANLARNVRQLFLLTLAISLACGIGGYLLCTRYTVHVGATEFELRPGGTIVVLTVVCFFASALAAAFRGRRLRPAD
jgi:zinc transport system permease protein